MKKILAHIFNIRADKPTELPVRETAAEVPLTYTTHYYTEHHKKWPHKKPLSYSCWMQSRLS